MQVLACTGMLLVCVGEIIRKSAILQAGDSFSHKIAFHKTSRHHLITTGIYGYDMCLPAPWTAWYQHHDWLKAALGVHADRCVTQDILGGLCGQLAHKCCC